MYKSEYDEQAMLVKWLRYNRIFFYHIPNGGYRHPIEASRFKKIGVVPGIPDICIPIPNVKYHSLYIEMKSKNGRITDKQLECMKELTGYGHCVFVSYGFDEAVRFIYDYMINVK